MNAAFQREKVLLVQAELDGELDAAEAASLSAHRSDCAECQAAAAELSRARSLSREDLYYPMPEDLRRRITAQIAAAQQTGSSAVLRQRMPLLDRLQRWWSSAAGFALGAVCSIALALLILTPREAAL